MDIKKYEKELNVISQYCGHPLTAHEVDFVIKFAEEEKLPIELIMEAFDVAVLKAPKMSVFRYAQQIIYHWVQDGIVSLEALREYEKKIEEEQEARAARKKEQYSRNNNTVQQPEQSVKHEPYYKDFDRENLKPCPFCGSDKIAIVHQHSSKFEAYYSKVECGVCGAGTRAVENFECSNPESEAMKNGRSVSEVIELWNNRK